MSQNPYEPPRTIQSPSPQPPISAWAIASSIAVVLGGFAFGSFGAMITYAYLWDLAVEEAYRRNPDGYWDDDSIRGDELPVILWYTPAAVFLLIASVFGLLGYCVWRLNRRSH